jgi:transposase
VRLDICGRTSLLPRSCAPFRPSRHPRRVPDLPALGYWEWLTLGADHSYVPLLRTVPGIGAVLGYTIAAEIGDITRFDSPKKLVGYTGLCPTVYQSGRRDHRAALAKNGPKYLRWALIEAATHAARHPVYAERYQRTRARLGKQRGPKVARVDLARRLAEAIWYMLTTNQPFAPAGAAKPLAA